MSSSILSLSEESVRSIIGYLDLESVNNLFVHIVYLEFHLIRSAFWEQQNNLYWVPPTTISTLRVQVGAHIRPQTLARYGLDPENRPHNLYRNSGPLRIYRRPYPSPDILREIRRLNGDRA